MQHSSYRICVLAFSIVLSAGTALFAQNARFALVVGNAAYSGDAALKNPANDAADIAASLKKVGWNVTLVTDADRRTFNRVLASFRDALSANAGATALFYYAGHGVQIDNANYLIPVKTEFETMDDIKNDSISIAAVTSAIEQAKASVSLIILDACRDNPFAKKMTRSVGGGTRGLSVLQNGGGSAGSAIVFSTSPGDVALDGVGRNGVFTTALLKYINSDLKLEDMFKKVTIEVREASAGSQKPWINTSLTGDFYFVSDEMRLARAAEQARISEETRQAELAKAVEAGRTAEALKTDAAMRDADAARKAAADAAALAADEVLKAQAALAAANKASENSRLAEQNRPKGKARFESQSAGKIFIGAEYYGEVGQNTPLMTESLQLGNVEVRFVGADGKTETKTISVTDKAYSTVIFGPPVEIQEKQTALSVQPSAAKIAADTVKVKLLLEDGFKKNRKGIMELSSILPIEQKKELYFSYDQSSGKYFLQNLLPVSVGSFAQGDILGGSLTTAFKIGGWFIVLSEIVPFIGTNAGPDSPLWLAGLASAGIGGIVSLCTPYFYAKDYNAKLQNALSIPLEPKKH